MLLVEITINAVVHRVSMDGIALDHWWDNKIISFSAPKIGTAEKHGGYAAMQFGSVSFAPDLFDYAWPPPVTCPITVKYTSKTETGAYELFSGTAHLTSIDRDSVTYALYGTSDDTEILSGTALAGSLVNIVSWFCDSARLNLSLDATFSRDPSPAVSYTVQSDTIALGLLSDICAFFSHCFYIKSGTLHLIDMLSGCGERSLTEFDFFPPSYEMGSPVAKITSDTGDVTISEYPYGADKAVTAYTDVSADVLTAMEDLLDILNAHGCRLRIPLSADLPSIGEKISWIDTALNKRTQAYIIARSLTYDFDNSEVVVDGEGVLS